MTCSPVDKNRRRHTWIIERSPFGGSSSFPLPGLVVRPAYYLLTKMWPAGHRQNKEYLKSRLLPDSVTADITGNAPVEIKELPIKWLTFFRGKGTGFAGPIVSRVKVRDVSILPSSEDPLKLEGKVTCEVEVTPGEYYLLSLLPCIISLKLKA